MDLADLRDVVIIVYGALGILLLLILIVISVATFRIVRGLRRQFTELVRESVRPTVDDVKQTVRNVRGASEFTFDRAIHPVIQAITLGRAIRRGARIVTYLRSRAGK